MTIATFIKGQLIFYSSEKKHGGTQVDMVMKKKLRILHSDLLAAGGKNDAGPGLSILEPH